MKEISSLGHEIGYHYEVLSKCNGDFDKAIGLFSEELDSFRDYFEVKTISMHGSPFSQWNNLDIWKKFDYKSYKILGEAYLSVNYSNIFYYTDTGRTWLDNSSNLRDRVETEVVKPKVSSTLDLANLIKKSDKNFIINTHPQRWHSNFSQWSFEYLKQNLKNIGKSFLAIRRKSAKK